MNAVMSDRTGAEEKGGVGIAVFDFDDTLIRGDSLPRFLCEVVGPLRVGLAVIPAVIGALLGPPAGVDFAGSVKARLLRATLAGVAVTAAHAAARRLKSRLVWLSPQRDALLTHAAAGRRIVVASGALDVYLPILLEGLPVDVILATAMTADSGSLTGRLAADNCVRQAKADRVAAYLAASAPTGPIWGYGNHPSDGPMLALVDHPTVI
jgi:phosphoserine phosphatase